MTNRKFDFPTVHITGERSIRFAFNGTLGESVFNQVQLFCGMVEKKTYLIEEVVPSYHTVTIFLKKPLRDTDTFIQSLLAKWEKYVLEGREYRKSKKLHIPVCYEEEFALDMERVIQHTGMSEKEIIALHTNTVYTVYMIGFLPGFPYLGQLDEKLQTPRLGTPRPRVPRGTVGIGGSQTGIYPLECPGGWNIIGKTPVETYHPDWKEPFLISAGDQLQFVAISTSEYYDIQAKLEIHPESSKKFILS